MKKLFTVLVAAALLFSIAGCAHDRNSGKAGSGISGGDRSQSAENEGSLPKDASEQVGRKTLVVYYSATGTTEKIANRIAGLIGADLFVIEPETEYTSADLDWTDDKSRVSIEHDHPENREVKLRNVKPNNFEGYDTVLIGYPIWWGAAAWPVDSFVAGNDFTGKTVIPFCTAASSDIGDSGKLLSEMAGSGEWLAGKRFYGSSSEEEISDWLVSLKLK